MSDMSQGPGWWIASDGKWYPPHLHPSVRVPEPSETGDGHLTNPSSAPADAVASGQQSETPSRFVAPQGSPGPDSAGPAISGQPGSFDYQAAAPAAKKRSRTPLAAAVSIIVVILLIVGAVVVFGNSTSASAKVINAVTSTLNDGTAHVTLNLSGSANVTGTGSGNIDFTDNALQLQMNVAADGQQVPISAIYLGGVV